MVDKLFPDISEYYVGEKVDAEERSWASDRWYQHYLRPTLRAVHDYGVKSVVEIGCGSGWIPLGLPEGVSYLGVDKNPHFLEMARKKNAPGRKFLLGDVRSLASSLRADLVVSFAVLKHFGLHEWDEVVGKILSLGTAAVIEMQISTHDFDNGTDFHHVFVSQGRLERAVQAAGHRCVSEETYNEDVVPGGHPLWSKLFTTLNRGAQALRTAG